MFAHPYHDKNYIIKVDAKLRTIHHLIGHESHESLTQQIMRAYVMDHPADAKSFLLSGENFIGRRDLAEAFEWYKAQNTIVEKTHPHVVVASSEEQTTHHSATNGHIAHTNGKSESSHNGKTNGKHEKPFENIMDLSDNDLADYIQKHSKALREHVMGY